MPRIYSWRELAEGKFASRENVETALANAKVLLGKLHSKGWIESGLLYGSGVHGDFTHGSDVDALLVPKPRKERAIELYLAGVCGKAFKHLGVEPSVIRITTAQAEAGKHGVSPDFLNRMRSGMFLVGTDPRLLLKFRAGKPRLLASVSQRILHRRERSVIESLEPREPNTRLRLKELGFRINGVFNTAREVLYAHNALPEDLGKPALVQAYEKNFSEKSPVAVSALNRVSRLFSDYQSALDFSINALKSKDAGRIAEAKDRYEKALERMKEIAGHNYVFTSENLKLLGGLAGRRPKRKERPVWIKRK